MHVSLCVCVFVCKNEPHRSTPYLHRRAVYLGVLSPVSFSISVSCCICVPFVVYQVKDIDVWKLSECCCISLYRLSPLSVHAASVKGKATVLFET